MEIPVKYACLIYSDENNPAVNPDLSSEAFSAITLRSLGGLSTAEMIDDGLPPEDRAIRLDQPGPYQVEAAIQALRNEPSKAEGPAAALEILAEPSIADPLDTYPHFHSTRADRSFLERRLREVTS
jgi:predicted RNA polymerase sigma factor